MSNFKKPLFWIVAILIVVGIGFFNSSRKPQVASSVTLGVIAGTTGQYAPAGEAYVKGFQLAMEEWNRSHTPTFNGNFEDDGFDAKKGLSAYQKLKGLDQVDAYAIVSSFTIDAVYDLVHAENKPVALGFEQSRPAEDDNIFQILPAAKPVQFALGQKVKELGYTKPVAAVSNNTSVYQNFYAGFHDGYGSDVSKFQMGSDIGDIRSQALAMLNANPDVVAFFMAPKDGALLVKELLKIAGTKKPYLVFDQSIQSGARDYQEVLGGNMQKIDGSLVSMSKNDFTADFIQAYKTKYNEVPPFASEMGYNSFMLLASTYSPDAHTWIENIKRVSFTGADGQVQFDATGLRTPNVAFGKLKEGKVE